MKEKKRKVWLNKDEVARLLETVKLNGSTRDYLMILLMRWGLRCGEIVGWRGLPGIRKEDLRSNGIWVKGKGYAGGIVHDQLYPLRQDVLDPVRAYAEEVQPGQKVFDLSEPHAEVLVKKYAREAGLEDWQHISPHRLRAFFLTDLDAQGVSSFTVMEMARHKNIQTTQIYIGRKSTEAKRQILEKLTESLSPAS